ncbi:PAS domain S-box-containing protein [Desulfosalsimonas propionicica]|uniref:PAS domain S-box-containing protein n=1 Tax=Desulfosalsimonas propionicica TaxID=332175 RepID=A0A7W0CAT9_9BACT|nr:PAS domain S-box protein [Desulfosalsimonas propionicica]MBA2882344.1 PAS domain S-box-containing protein [Desulfosalsimonas propionicica]
MTDSEISEEEAREYAESVINTVRESLIVLNQDLRVISANRSFYDAFQVKPEKTVGQFIYDLGNKQWDIPKLRQLLETLLPRKTTLDNYEVEHVFAGIGRRTMLFNAREIQRKSGKDRLILLAIEDITERKRLENLLSESEERYRRLFETANDGMLLLEKAEGKIIHANPAITEMLGYRHDELYGKEVIDIGFPGDIGTIREILQALETDGILTYKDAPVQTKTGQIIYTDIYMVDKARLVQCNIRNITDRKRMEEDLQKIEWMLSSRKKTPLSEDHASRTPYVPPYGDLTQLNTSREILDAVGEETLKNIVGDFLDMLETSVAVYEKNSDYALGIFSSAWCRLMDQASYRLCRTDDLSKALSCGRWLCHESCRETAKQAAETELPVDVACEGGIRLYAVPIFASGEIIGTINVGYGDPPTEINKLSELAKKYSVDVKDLIACSNAYESRPPFIIELAKQRIHSAAHLIGEILERKRAEEALRRSENYYRAIFETSGTAMFIIEEDTTIPLVNSNFEELSGYLKQEVEGKKFWTEFIQSDDLAWMKENHYLRRQNPEAAPRHYEFRFINRRNEKRNILVAVDMIPGTNRSIASCIDITDRKKAEDALRQSENYYRAIFETSGSAMFILEQDTTISHVNSNFEKLSGYSREELEWKKSWTEFVHSDDVEWMKKNHYSRRRDPRAAPLSYEFRFFSRNGELRHGYLTVNIIPNTTQSVVSLIDITERKRAEMALRQSEAKLQTIIEAAEGFISTHDRQLRIEFMSKSLIDKMGRDATGEFCYKALWGFDSPCPWCRSDSVFDGKAGRLEYQNPKTGCWYYTILSPIFNESGRVSTLEALTIDITERKRQEIALAERAAYLDKENIRLKSSMKERFRFGDIIGKSPAMQGVYDMIVKAAATGSNVVIYGETGTGKELVAKAIHENSDRRDAPFVAVNCGAIPDTLIESEFFGYKKGAFTGAEQDKKGFLAMADGGTLFLDEIGEIGHGMQVKLLRVIEGYGYTPVGENTPVYQDIRLIAATHRNLSELVKTGVMREDFFYRIDVIPIHIPPLRERRDDLPLLIEHFRQAYSDQAGFAPLTGEILNAIQNYDWPGNVRELQNVLDRYFTLGLFYIPKSLTEIPQPKPTKNPVELREALARYEKDLILSALEHSKWRRGRAADRLGITRRTLYKKMKRYRID